MERHNKSRILSFLATGEGGFFLNVYMFMRMSRDSSRFGNTLRSCSSCRSDLILYLCNAGANTRGLAGDMKYLGSSVGVRLLVGSLSYLAIVDLGLGSTALPSVLRTLKAMS